MDTQKKKMDKVSILREKLKEYHKAEQALMASRTSLCEVELENYQDSYIWLRLPSPGVDSDILESRIRSNIEDFSNTCLAGILEAILRSAFPKDIHLNGLAIYKTGTLSHFCISGLISLEELQKMREYFLKSFYQGDEKKIDK